MGRGSAAEARRADQEGAGVGDDCEGDCGDESAVFEMMKVLRDAGACFCFMDLVEFGQEAWDAGNGIGNDCMISWICL